MSLFALLTEILFVGHSLVGPDLPRMVESGMVAMADPRPVEAQVINGASLKWNWEHSAEAEGVDGRALLQKGGVRDLILTEAQPIAEHLQWSDSADMVELWAKAAAAGDPDARVWLYETWPALPPVMLEGGRDLGVEAWQAEIRAALPLWHEIAGDEAKLIPAGQAMLALSEAIAAGEIATLSSIRDLFSDDIHPNGKGHYLVAMVQLAALTGREPQDLPERLLRVWPNRAAIMTKAEAALFQKIAWQSLKAYEAAAPQINADLAALKAEAAEKDSAVQADEPKPSAQGLMDATEAVIPPDAQKGEMALARNTVDPSLEPKPQRFDPIANPNLALGLAGVNDWSVQQPFLDVMKTARPWIGHKPGQWGGWAEADLREAGALDADGWPVKIPEGLTGITTLVLTDLPETATALAGRYSLLYEGAGELRLEGRAEEITTAPGRIEFRYHPGPGSVILTLLDTDTANPLRKIRILRKDHLALAEGGAIFNPDWTARIKGIRMFRAMDWMATNNSRLSALSDRPKPSDYTWARQGVPLEVILQLANALEADPWLTLPHLAEDALLREMAAISARDLHPERKLWVEFSNEVWNWQFEQARWADGEAQARWGAKDAWIAYYALRASEAMAIFAAALPADRLQRVISSQTGWLGLEAQILAAAPVLAEGLPPPAQNFDAYAITGYFAAGLGGDAKREMVLAWLKDSADEARKSAETQGLSGEAAAEFIASHRFDAAITRAAQELRDGSLSGQSEDTLLWLRDVVFPHHARVAKDHGLSLVMYEGGTHVTAQGAGMDNAELTAFFTALNYSPEMGTLYHELLQIWAGVTPAPFNAFVDVESPTKWGSWGALRHLGDDNPRWQALAKGCGTC